MHKNLLEIYKSLNISSKVFFIKIIESVELNKNLIVTGYIGIHRTLSYLKPLLKLIESTRENSQKDYLKATDTLSLFQPQKLGVSTKHGALIVVPHLEMLYTTYAFIRQLSPLLSIFRTNSISNKV